jgi:hypothetical protein
MKWVLKTSTLRVATRQKDFVSQSIDDLPPEWQEKVLSTLRGPNTKTIFLANQEAYDRIAHVTSDMSPEMNPFLNTPFANRPPALPKSPRPRLLGARRWASLGFCLLVAGVLVWLALNQIGTP